MTAQVEVMDLVAQMKAAEQAFVLATVVRTVSVTAAKAGAKAIIRPDGTIAAGWIGGGRARGGGLKGAGRGAPPRGSQGGPDALRRRGAADGLGAAGKPSGRARRQARREPRRRALCRKYVPEQ